MAGHVAPCSLHRPLDLRSDGPGVVSNPRLRQLARTTASATGHGLGREGVRWTRKEEVYLQGVDEIERRRKFGDPPAMLCGGDERRDLHKPQERKQEMA